MKKHIKSNADNSAKNTFIKVYLFMSLLFFSLSLFSLQSTEIEDNTIPLRYQPTNFNVIPKAPGAAELGNFISQGLNEATGSPVISIPIYTLETDQVSVPINISYNATGIKPEEISTEVGLKWSLQAGGSISRVIKGLPDDDNNGWLYCSGDLFPDLSWNQDFACYQDQFKNIANNYVDITPDEFSYDFPGHNGTFIFDRDKNIHKKIDDKIKISPIWDQYNILIGFKVIDESGNKYKFGGDNYISTTEVVNFPIGGNYVKNEARSGKGINEWKLDSIITRNGKNIVFNYEVYSLNYNLVNSEVVYIDLINTTHRTIQPIRYNNSYIMDSLLIPKSIESENTLITFNYEDFSGANIWNKSLSGIVIKNKVPETVKQFSLDFDLYSGNNMLRLRKINEVSTNSGEPQTKTWGFNYKDDVIPPMSTYDVDFFGYYNAAGNSSFVEIERSIDGEYYIIPKSKNINTKTVANGILNEVIYPTGGKTKYYYEANFDIISGVDSIFAPGVRVSKTEDFDSQNSSPIVKEYKYSGLSGNIHLKNNYTFYQKNYTIATIHKEIIFYSNERENLFPKSGYCYSKIETHFLKDNNVYSKQIDTYSPNEKNNKLYPQMIESISFDNYGSRKQRIKKDYYPQRCIETVKSWEIKSDNSDLDEYSCAEKNFTVPKGTYYYQVSEDQKYLSYTPSLLLGNIVSLYFGSDSLVTNTSYDYDLNYQLYKKNYWTSESNKEIVEEYIYPNSTEYNNLYLKNVLNVPLQITTYKREYNTSLITEKDPIILSSIVIDKKKYDYDNNANILFYSDFVNNSALNYLRPKNEISYDSQFNIKEIKDLSSGLNTIYIWSYKGYPIAEIKNATYGTVESLLGGATNVKNLAESMNPNM